MKKLGFLTLEIENFGAFSARQVLDLGSLGPGLHFICGRNEAEPRLGPNGAGKSTLWGALTWCLFGRTVSGLKNPDIKPYSNDNAHTIVRATMRVNGKRHSIQREANPNLLLLDDSVVGQEHVDDLLGVSFETFTHTILFGQGQPLFLDLAPRDKMQLFSNVLGLDKWEERSKAASDRAGELETQRATMEGAVAAEEAALEDLWGLRDKAEAASKDWKSDWGEKQRVSQGQMEDTKKRLDAAQKRFDEIEVKYDWECVEIKTIIADLDRLRGTTAPAKSLRLTLERLKKEFNSDHDVCPTCGQQLDPKSLGRHLSEMRAQIKEIEGALRTIARAEKQELALREKLAEHRKLGDQYYTELEKLQPTMLDLKSQKKHLEKAMEEKQEEKNPYHEQLQDLRKQINKAKAEITESKQIIERLVRRIERAKFWVKGFKDVRLYLIDEVLQELEIATNAALDDVGLVGWKVEYAVEKETKSGTMQRGLNVAITAPGLKRRVRWESWSGGESQRLRIVGSLALSEVLLGHAGVDTSMEVLDEPAHFMAPEGVRDLADYLAVRAQGLERSTLYIDHLAVDSAAFATTTTVVKGKDGARIERGHI